MEDKSAVVCDMEKFTDTHDFVVEKNETKMKKSMRERERQKADS